ncbi:hypothetical protein SADO_00210 [Salinisphaera dokdonensis CL-ES53]|uniref:Polyphosphate kinase-2-related domain-containing protein n=1 Tax=Salinisphaera dokdonensis CL-ES53 TaxID=1304272 RepID=A0ABV2AVK2_9GAMM
MGEKRKARQELEALQAQLQRLQLAYARQGRSAVIVLEGWDAAGKGGLIRRIGWVLDPRTLSVWQTGAPDAVERREHWLQRFWRRIPPAGEIAIFDRSWYGRVLVERVEGFAPESAWQRAYDEINAFEQTLVDDGIRLVKLFLDIDSATQLERFTERYENPAKRWKLTAEDIRNRARWEDYEKAYADMFKRCSTAAAPWQRIDANDKRAARVAALREVVAVLAQDVDTALPAPDTEVDTFMAALSRRRAD